MPTRHALLTHTFYLCVCRMTGVSFSRRQYMYAGNKLAGPGVDNDEDDDMLDDGTINCSGQPRVCRRSPPRLAMPTTS